MKLKPIGLLFPALLLVVLVSCSKKSNVPVPADAGFVVHINGKSLSSKLSWEEIRQSEWYKLAYEKSTDSLAKQVMNDPASSGIDIEADTYIFMKARGRGAYSALVGSLKDEKTFAAFMEKAMKGKPATREGELSVIRSDKSVMTWKGNRFVMVTDIPDYNVSQDMMGGPNPDMQAPNPGFPADSLAKFASEVYEIKGSSSVGNNEKFASMLQEKGDAHLWINAKGLYGGSLPSILALTKVSLLFDGNVTAATVNFDNGKITLDGKSYYNKELEALYKKHKMVNIDESMLKAISSQNVAAVVAINYPPQGLKEFLTLLGLDGLINMALGQDYTIDEFVKANKGDVLFAVSDFGVTGMNPMDSAMGNMGHTSHKFGAKFLFATSVNDRPAFEKLMSVIQKKLGQTPEAATAMGRIPYQLKDKWFVAGNDSLTISSYGTSSQDHAFISRISGHPMGGYVDIQKFINGGRPAMDSAAQQIADQSLKTWQDIVFHGGEFKGDATLSHFEINLVDKNTNSLKQLNAYLGFVARIADEQEKKKQLERNRYGTDSLQTVPAAPSPSPEN